ncbi:hypothetical protein JAAARDRAFT_75108 [Jaapia argillacea MUCL 33604]|uniref:Actin cytoskeleton-regulatory complex protein SLA1 n=1 Tax=Jaapia argillacea MUCL 33604 TaxID=933084 RepID=A0A067QC09_9AGAM|nr:hypothetical protein JAAARDRAFT_75108 [Jaapia argillacea MUCL 33604]
MADHYLAVIKASYEYEPQAEDEIAVKEDQLLFLLEKVDDDWWKVKLKTDSQEDEGPIGLVPSAYVEPAEPISTVKAIYDYEASSGGELSIREDEILDVFAKEEDWILVQSRTDGGLAGYVPANYVEEARFATGDEPAASPPSISQIVVPPSPPKPTRPISTYVDPADRVAATKANADDIKTWAVSEVDKKGKKKKGTLGVGNGAVFFASESDKTPVQKWQTSSISTIRIDKSKHVLIDIAEPTPISLHFNAHSKDTAEAIVAKLESSKALAQPSISETLPAPPQPPTGRVSPKVHFAEEEPEVIPPRESSEDGVEEELEYSEEPAQEEEQDVPQRNGVASGSHTTEGAEMATALYDFPADGEDELSVQEGEQLFVLERDGDEWWKCRNAHGGEGVVPASYLELVAGTATNPHAHEDEVEDVDTSAQDAAAQAEAERLEQERIARERARKEREQHEKEQKKREAERTKAKELAERKRKEEKEQKEKELEDEKKKVAEKQRREQTKREEAEKRRSSSNQSTSSKSSKTNGESSSRPSSTAGAPPPEKTRTWRDRSGQFRVDAALLGYRDGKLRLHKVNGVVIEVPAEKMSVEDMKYVEKVTSKKSGSPSSSSPSAGVSHSDDDEPLAVRRRSLQPPQPQPPARAVTPKKGPAVDWFEFFLSAGCDVDDCTRYASSFERDKIDEAILPDITESTMRSLGLREGDIIRVKKAIDQRQPKDSKSQEQVRKDEELARQLQAEENASSGKGAPPNLFAGPNGVLKNNTVRRGRPQPSKTLPPPSVDLDAISTASDHIHRVGTPVTSSSASPPIQSPQRSNSAAAAASGFDDDAWTNRPSSTKPTAPTPVPAPSARAPSAPPAAPAPPPPPPPAPAPPPALAQPQTAATVPPVTVSQPQGTGASLANKSEADIFEQLARLSELRTRSPAVPSPVSPAVPPVPPPVGYRSGLGMGPSPVPIGQHLQGQQTGLFPPPQQSGPRGPFAPVPANQSLLQPLIPTSTGFNNFVPTRPSSAPFQPQPQFLAPQPTGFGGSPQPFLPQPTGFAPQGPLLSQPTGMNGGSFGNFNPNPPYQNTGFSPVSSNPTGFNPGFGQFSASGLPPVPPLPNAPSKDTSPANVFAQMKSGSFASGNDSGAPQTADKYDALRPNSTPIPAQVTGWGYPTMTGYQGFSGYQR